MKLNEIQLWGDNPRKITDEAFEKLKASLSNDTDYLKERKILLNKIDWKVIVYWGNQRVKALIELWYKELKKEWYSLVEISEKEMIIRWLKDNEEYWEYDRTKLAELQKKMKTEYEFDFADIDIPNVSLHKLQSLSNGFEMPDFSDDLSGFDTAWIWDSVEELEDENSKKKREQNYIIRTEIIFDNELQRENYNWLLHYLKENYGWETMAERLDSFITKLQKDAKKS